MTKDMAKRPFHRKVRRLVENATVNWKKERKMKKTTITCDCCGNEMSENTGAEIRAQLRDKGMRFEMDGELDKPVTGLDDVCDECAIVLHRAIRDVMKSRKLTTPIDRLAERGDQ